MLTATEEHQLLIEFNNTEVKYPKNKTIVDLFEEQAARTPGATAIVFQEEHLTYKELNERSNKLGHYLRSVGVKEETLVPIYIERSLEIVIGILGILKAGAAYVPVDTDYPLERINFMLKDTGASVAVGSKKSSLKVKAGEDLHVIKLDEEFPGLLEQPSTHVPSSLSPNNLCYVIYTSGSTGQPKGVLIEHKSLLDYLFGLKQTVSIDHCNSFALLATLATDLGNTILYSSLISGGILHLFSYEKINDFHFLHKYFNEHSIECLKIVPSHWKALSDGDNLLLPLKLLIFGGEALGSDVINNIITAGFNGQIINHYGPTETTIGKLLYTINPFDNYKNSIPIGKSFSNSRVYVITKNNQICPIGISGEICISGDGLARGYLNHEDLTRDKFVNNPFSKDGSKMYRTGDKGRWLPDGNIEFLGRFDDQVKIHGFRIELGEVETVIQQSELVKQAVVLARKDNQGNNGLIGYIVPAGSLNREALKDYLKYKLPEYMIPAKWVELERLPLTLNGKIDKKALPDFDAGEVLNENYVAPRNEIERKLAEIWKQVLDIEKVGVHNNFFELGGDSLLAIRLLSSIRKELVVEMPISDVFDYPTIASFVESLSGQITPSSFSTLEAQPRPDIIPLSFGQERFWFLQQLHGGVQYHISYVLRLKGNLHKEGVEYALQTLVNRHEILRTVIRSHNGLVHQIIKDKNTWQLSISEGVQYANKRLELKQYIGELISKPFNLSEDNLLRATLITLSEQENLLVATLHHIASDGWSESIMVKELVQLYNTFRKGDAVYLPELKLQYADFAIWQRNHYQGDWLSSKLLYWRNKLKGIASLQLPADYLRPPIQSTSGAGVDFDIDKKLLSGLQQLSHQHGVTLFMTLVSVFKVMLHRYTGQEDIPVGIPIANRNRKEVEELIGFFVNTLVLRSEVNSNKVFIEFLQQIKTTTLEAYDHQEVPFEKVVEAVVKERDPSRNPLFQVMFVMQNVPPIPGVGLADVEVLVEDYERKTSKFDLTFIITKTPVGLKASVEYCTDLFSEQTILRMIGHYKELLGSIVKQPYEKIGMLSMLKATEEHQLLVGFNDTAAEYPKDKTILDLFEEQAAGTPEAIALVFEQQQLTYLELNERCNQLAHYLRSKGVKEETLVPICIERSVEMIIGILGILKAGGAYVPIDPEYPDERIAYMMEDTGAKMVLSSKKNRSTLQSLIGVEIIELDLDWSVISKQSSSNLQIDIQPHHLAYVIYTSGSTGKPKGVMIEHGSLAASTITRNSYYKYVGSILLIPSFSFDSSVAVIFWAVSTGGRLIISKEQSIKDTHHIKHLLTLSNTILCVPSYYRFLLDEELVENSSLSKVILAGEEFDQKLVSRHYNKTKGILLYNEYGPTENTVWTTVSKIESTNVNVTIGKPINNTKIYITNNEGQLMPLNVPGEICIGGTQIARGYLNRKNLTAEKFIDDRFSRVQGSRLYKTGDIGRWLPDGNIEYLGRIDDQVKIRGYRIELGEIESVLLQSGHLKTAVVVAHQDSTSNKSLVGYVVPEIGFNRDTMVAYLKSRLPEYMVPALWIELEHLPLTFNGKIDRKALPEPDKNAFVQREYVAPATEVEQSLVGIWQELLHRQEIGIHDNFYELGGHSLMAMRVNGYIRKQLDVELSIKDLFVYPTIAGLAAHIQAQKKGLLLPAIKIQSRPDRIPLSFSQERLWFIDQLEGSVQYHIPTVLRLNGQLNKDALAFALQAIINRHEVLRTVIRQEEGEAFQYIKGKDAWQLNVVDGYSYQNNTQVLQQYIDSLIKQPFDLSGEDVLRASLIILSHQEHILVVTIHHIASDGWSTSILIRELVELYKSYIEDRPKELEPLEIQYADYALWQRQYLQGEVLDKKISYWKEKLEGVAPLQLPTDYPRPTVQSTKGALTSFTIDKDLRDRLQQLNNEQSTTFFMTLLASFKVLLYRYSGQQDICAGSPIAGRQHEVEDLIGFFVNTLALRSEVCGDATFIELLQQVRTTTLEAYEHQDVPFEKVVNAVVKERDISRPPLFQVMFVLQNIPEVPQLRLGELELIREDHEHNTSKFDLTFVVEETDEGVKGRVEYCTDLFSKARIEQMIGHYKILLCSIAKEPGQKIGTLPMLTQAEQHQLLKEFNNTDAVYPQNKSVIALFEEQAAKTPDAIAVVFEGEQLSYRHLNERANQLSHYLRRKGVREETLVPVCLERSIELIVGILGIMKAGGAYVPIDPGYPEERIHYMLQDIAATIVFSKKEHMSKLPSSPVLTIIAIDENKAEINKQSTQNLSIALKTNQLAYIIYTSGSTGKPKGVLIEQKGLVNLIAWHIKEYNVGQSSRATCMAGVGFDAFGWEVWPYLVAGASLYIMKDTLGLEPFHLAQTIAHYAISHCFMPTALVADFVRASRYKKTSLCYLLTGGDTLSSISNKEIGYKIVNNYGPTEYTVVATKYELLSRDDQNIAPPIGSPVANTTVLILNEQLHLVPVGVMGEICIGGEGLSRGYLNQPRLTAEKFVAHPYNKEPNARIYRTGDLGRWLPNGNIEYMGRIDDQVKIRGYRIELGEIESVLLKSGKVKATIVVAREDSTGNIRLTGYVVPEGGFDRNAIVSYMKRWLPEYMVPAFWIDLERLPVTANGKIDKKALPVFDAADVLNENYVAPRNETEKMLTEIWEKVLEVEKVGINNNFFELGGHSLTVLMLASQVRELGLQINVKDFFVHQTIEKQSNFIRTSQKLLSAAGEGKYIIPIQPKGTNIPLFAFTEFLLYSKVGEHIGKNQPFYSIERSPYEKKEEIVAHYISEIKKIYSHGPYCLAGFCKWGDIAVEMAQRLVEQGEEVPLLILIEYYSSQALRSRMSPKFLGPKIKYFFNTLRETNSFKGKGKFIVEEMENLSQFIAMKLIGKNNNNRVGKNSYSGKVVLVRASDTYEYYDNCNMGWSEYFIGEIENITIKGNHLNIMRNPAAAQLAEKLNAILEKTSERYSRNVVTEILKY